jgi:hypothetical protein
VNATPRIAVFGTSAREFCCSASSSWWPADIVRTVALEPTLESVAVLGLLVVIRTFLSWSLIVEIEGRWPWQAVRTGANEQTDRL